MVGAAMGLAARGAIPFPSTFACFLTRAADFIRMAGISIVNVKLAGSHAGISIGEDGPSQMALEDLAMMRAVPDCAGALSVRRGQHRAAGRRDGAAPGPGLHADVAAEDAGDLRARREVPDRRVQGSPAERGRRGDGGRRRRHRVRGAQGLRHAQGRGDRDPRDRRLLAAADRRGDPDRGARRRPAARSSPSRTTIRPAASATRSARRWRPRAWSSSGWRSAKFRAAASPTNCSTLRASPPGTSSTPSREVEKQVSCPLKSRQPCRVDAEQRRKDLPQQFRPFAEQREEIVALEAQRDARRVHLAGQPQWTSGHDFERADQVAGADDSRRDVCSARGQRQLADSTSHNAGAADSVNCVDPGVRSTAWATSAR